MIIGYARTSTQDQIAGLAAQERDLRAAGAERIVSEQASSVGKRPAFEACLASLASGDVLVVTKPDRLARSTAHLLTIIDDLTRRSVGLILLSMGGERLDTRNPTSRLLLTVLAAIAAFERDIMLERQREGVAKARREGKYKAGSHRSTRRGCARWRRNSAPRSRPGNWAWGCPRSTGCAGWWNRARGLEYDGTAETGE